MSAAAPVGILGGYGSVGRVAARRLRAWSSSPIRIGGRSLPSARRFVADELGGAGEAVAADAGDSFALARFCAGCAVVVNCAGPSVHIGDAVARAAAAAGADYVDAAGDTLYDTLTAHGVPPRRTAVLAAGMTPGLSALLPRALALGFTRARHLTAFAGGLDRLSGAAAVDYVTSFSDGSGESLAAWRDGRRAPRALAPRRDVVLPFFPHAVTAHPYLSCETERLARSLGLVDASWYNVFDGSRVLAVLSRAASAGAEGGGFVLDELMRAAELDLFGRKPYQVMVFELAGDVRGSAAVRTLVLHGRGAAELTGTTVALATIALERGELARGVHFAADVLDPARALERLRRAAPACTVELIDVGAAGDSGRVEEGVL